jgi:hypothetical protein
MNIYFSCSITGGRQDQEAYSAIVDYLIEEGHIVPTAHLSSPNVLDLEQIASAEVIYARDVQWVQECDALIAEVSTPSHGVGYEIAMANLFNKPVLCCHRTDRKVSKMILGNPSSLQQVCAYQYPNELVNIVSSFLKSLPCGHTS